MLGLELADHVPGFSGSDKPAALQMVNRLHAAGVLTIPAGTQIVRLLPPLNLKPQEAAEGVRLIEKVIQTLV
jgi:acetylornithine/succinyldiaminopimelate/putrescine aminotransferase